VSLRILIGLLIAAAVALVPVANVLVLRWWPPPDFTVKLQPCSNELPPHVPCITGDQRPRRLIAHGIGAAGPPPDAPVEAVVDGPHFVHGDAGIPGGPAAGRRMMRVISFGGPDTAMGGPDMQPLRRHFMMVNLISLALVVSLAVLLVSVLLRAPFRALIGAIGDIERGAAPPAWAFSGPVEFRRVGHALEKLGRQLRSNLQERELMLAGLSHDIRSPLARIQAALELRSTDSERWIDTLRDVREIDHIIGQCIDFARDGQDEPLHSSSLDRIVTDTLGAPDAQGWCTAGARLELGAPQPQLLRVGAFGKTPQFRFVSEDLEWRGQHFKKGQSILLNLTAAWVDEAKWPNPRKLDITRRLDGNIVFGAGAHFCIGTYLVRVQGGLMIQELMKRFPNAELVNGDGDVEYDYLHHNARRINRLLVKTNVADAQRKAA